MSSGADLEINKIIKFPLKKTAQKKSESVWTCSSMHLAKIIEFPQKSPERKKFEETLKRFFGLGEVPEELLDELWHYTLRTADKLKSLRSSFNVVLSDTLSEKDSAVISAAVRNSVDVFIDKGTKIFKEMLREIIVLRLAVYKLKRSL